MRQFAATVIAAGALAASASSAVLSRQVVVTDGLLRLQNQGVPKGTGIVLGRTVDPGTGQPVPGAAIFPMIGSILLETIVSDGQGRFVLRDLPKGRLQINASKPGYVNGKYGKNLPDTGLNVGTDWMPLDLEDGARIADATIFLWKFAAIEGRVTDERDDPMVGMSVRALRVTYTGGRRRFSGDSSGSPNGGGPTALTDDRGVFRIPGLIPGEYAVVVPIVTATWPRSLQRMLASPGAPAPGGYNASSSGAGSWQNRGFGDNNTYEANDEHFAFNLLERVPGVAGFDADGRPLIYETQYYPNTTTLARASVIALGSGAERTGVDFQMRPTRTVKVSGVVNGPSGPMSNLVVRLVPDDSTELTNDPELTSTVTDADGTFTFLGVVPGQYVLKCLVTPIPKEPSITSRSTTTVVGGSGGGSALFADADRAEPLPTEATLWAEVPIDAGDRDIRDVTVTLRPGARILGRVEFEGQPDATLPSTATSAHIEPADGTRSVNLNLLLARVDTRKNFSSFGQPAGRYFVRIPWQVEGWNFEGAMLGDKNLSVTPLEVGSEDITGVVLKFTAKPLAAVSGVVRSNQEPAPAGSSVIIFPTDRSLWNELGESPMNVRCVSVGVGGRYLLNGLPAGEYFIASTPEARIDWSVARNLEALAQRATRVQIARGEQRTLDLSVIVRPPEPVDLFSSLPRPHGPLVNDEQTQAAPPRDVRPTVPAGSGVITGVVVTGQAKTPLRRAQVTLTGAGQVAGFITITGDDGTFAFANVPAGRFALSASKPAYLEMAFGASRTGLPGTPVTLTDGQRLTGLTIALARGGVITGRITDANGAPIQRASVRAMKYVTRNGVRRLQSVTSSGNPIGSYTDDRGMFRLHSLEPGEYTVGASVRFTPGPMRVTTAADVQFALDAMKSTASASPTARNSSLPAASADAARPLLTYVPILYPGTGDVSQAVMFTLGPAEEKSGIDFSVQPVPAAMVSGTVINPAGDRPANTEVRLINVGGAVTVDPFDGVMAGIPMRPQANGAFTFTGVAPGRYAIVASSAAGGRGTTATNTLLWATTEVTVSGRNESGTTLSLQPGIVITGSVTFERTTLTPPAVTAVRAFLNPILTSSQVAVGQFSTMADGDGTFRIPVMPGRYNVRANLPTGVNGWLMKSAMYKGKDVADEDLEVRPGDEPPVVTVTFTDRPAELSGTLQDASSRPATDYFIIVFPVDKTLWRSGGRRIFQRRPGTDGKFIVRNLLAGEYQIAALTDVAPDEEYDPAFLEKLVGQTIKVTVGEGEKKTQDIRVGGSTGG